MINLKEVITKYPECLESASKLRSFLVDLYPEEKRSIAIITTIFDCGIAEEIKNAKGEIDDLTINSYCNRLENTYAYSTKFSRECLLLWSDAYDVTYKSNFSQSTQIKNSPHEVVPTKRTIEKPKINIKESTESPSIKSNIKVGDIIILGTYPHGANGEAKPIEWQVLDVKNRQALVISKYAIDHKKYNESYSYVTWETCTLRMWLNGEFYRKTFGDSDKAKIVTTILLANKNPYYTTSPKCNETQDKVFLLSLDEANTYLKDEKARKRDGTDYCYRQGADKYSNNGCSWWLRTSGHNSVSAANVDNNGHVYVGGSYVGCDGHAICPAMWIKI